MSPVWHSGCWWGRRECSHRGKIHSKTRLTLDLSRWCWLRKATSSAWPLLPEASSISIFFVCLLSFCPSPQYNILLIRDQRDKHTQTEIYSLKKSIGWINSCPCKVLGLRSSTITENWLCQQDSKNTEENNNNKKHKISRLGKQRLLLWKQPHRTLIPRGKEKSGREEAAGTGVSGSHSAQVSIWALPSSSAFQHFSPSVFAELSEPKEPCKTCACISIGEKEPSLQKAGRAASALALCIFLSNAWEENPVTCFLPSAKWQHRTAMCIPTHTHANRSFIQTKHLLGEQVWYAWALDSSLALVMNQWCFGYIYYIRLKGGKNPPVNIPTLHLCLTVSWWHENISELF